MAGIENCNSDVSSWISGSLSSTSGRSRPACHSADPAPARPSQGRAGRGLQSLQAPTLLSAEPSGHGEEAQAAGGWPTRWALQGPGVWAVLAVSSLGEEFAGPVAARAALGGGGAYLLQRSLPPQETVSI